MKAQARIGDFALCEADFHGCPACAHRVEGPAIGGSSNVLINGLPAVRERDPGIHVGCCGTNTWESSGGSRTVFINGRAASRRSDPTRHCGGTGQLTGGSPDVFVGDATAQAPAPSSNWIGLRFVNELEAHLTQLAFALTAGDGTTHTRDETDPASHYTLTVADGLCSLELDPIQIPEINDEFF
jgi:uncharacterized Zn-binding protein involved in type VI secretion